MAKIPLDVGRKNDLLAHLSRKEKLSAEDEWLDHDANLVDEEALVDTLDEASDYKRILAMLDMNKQSLIQKLMGYGAEKADVNRSDIGDVSLKLFWQISGDTHVLRRLNPCNHPVLLIILLQIVLYRLR